MAGGGYCQSGPDSLSILRFVRGLNDAAVMVLGNHDLHLLMVAEGCVKLHRNDTLQEILDAPDRDELLHWLRHQRLLHVDGNYVMVHAGLLPSWSIAQAIAACANSRRRRFAVEDFHEFCRHMYGNQPDHWDDSFEGYARLRVIINAMTRMRVCTPDGKMDFAYKGLCRTFRPAICRGSIRRIAPAGKQLSFVAIGRRWVCKSGDNLIALDTGCLWGEALPLFAWKIGRFSRCLVRQGKR